MTDKLNLVLSLDEFGGPSNLIKLHEELFVHFKKCSSCGSRNVPSEVKANKVFFKYNEILSKSVSLAESGSEFKRFCDQMVLQNEHFRSGNIQKMISLKQVHGQNCQMSESENETIIPFKDIYFSEFVKILLDDDGTMYTYLKQDGETVERYPEMDSPCLNALLNTTKTFLENRVSVENRRLRVKNAKEFGSTCKFQPFDVIPKGFLVTLREYQKRNLAWMIAVEDERESDVNTAELPFFTLSDNEKYIKFKIAHTPYYVDLYESKLTLSPHTTPIPKLKLKGGLLLDMPGSGKKVTALALIHSNPKTVSSPKDAKGLINSRATLVICLQNSYHQWIFEARKCNPEFTIFCFSDDEQSEQAEQYPIDSFADLDIIIITYQAYKKYSESLFKHIHFSRIILDQYHASSAQLLDPENVTSDFIWALGCDSVLQNAFYRDNFKIFEGIFWNGSVVSSEISKKSFKKNEDDFKPCHIETKIIPVKPKRLDSQIDKNLLCYDGLETELLVEPKKIEDIESKLVASKKHTVTCAMRHLEKEKIDEDQIEKKQKLEPSKIEKVLVKAQGELNYAKEVIQTVKSEFESMKCFICYNDMIKSRMTILDCAHVFCFDCINGWLENEKWCPVCRQQACFSSMMCLSLDRYKDQISLNDFGRKFISLYNYLLETLDDSTARIIIYVQTKAMAEIMNGHLKSVKLDFSRLNGSAQDRHEAIAKFRTSEVSRILLTCYEEEVCGTHFPEATHIIYYHIFCNERIQFHNHRNKKYVMAENMGIGMLNYYESNRTINEIRFICQG